jgi:hypothetical protein
VFLTLPPLSNPLLPLQKFPFVKHGIDLQLLIRIENIEPVHLHGNLERPGKGPPLEPAHLLTIPHDPGLFIFAWLELDDQQILAVGADVDQVRERVVREAAGLGG